MWLGRVRLWHGKRTTTLPTSADRGTSDRGHGGSKMVPRQSEVNVSGTVMHRSLELHHAHRAELAQS